MKTSTKRGYWVATLFAAQLFFTAAILAQTAAVSPEDQYLAILKLQKEGNHDQVFAESKNLIEDAPQFVRAYFKLIESAFVLNKLPEVKGYFETSLKINPANAYAYYGMALYHRRLREYSAVIEQTQLCLQKKPDFAPAYSLLADSYLSLQNPEEAEAFFKSIPANHPGHVSASYGLGYLYSTQRRWPESLASLNQALTFKPDFQEALDYKAYVFYYTGRYAESLLIYQSLFETAKAKADFENQTRAQVSIGTLRRILGEHVAAKEDLTSGLRGAEEIGNRALQVFCLGNLAGLALQQDDYAKALSDGLRWLSLSKLTEDNQNANRALGHLGATYRALGDLEQAIANAQQSVLISRQINDQHNLASVLTDLAGLHIARKNYEAAQACLTESLPITRKLQSRALERDALAAQAHLHYLTQNYSQSWETQSQALQIAREIKTSLREGNSLNYLGVLKLQASEWKAAQELFTQSLALGERTQTPNLIWQAYAGLAAAAKGQGLFEQALNYYQRSITTIEQTRTELKGEEERAGFFQDKIDVYRKLVALLFQLQSSVPTGSYSSEAFQVAERARARAFSDLLAESKLNLEQSLAPELTKQQQPLQQALSAVNSRLIKARALPVEQQNKLEIEMLENELNEADKKLADWWRDHNRRYADLKYPAPVNLTQTQKLLATDQVMLAYSLGTEESYLFAVSRKNYQVYKLAPAERLGQQVAEFVSALTDKPGEANVWPKHATGLYRQLIQPASKFLLQHPATRELIILPDSALHRLPFEALLEPSQMPVADTTKLPYLIKRYALSYAPSATVLKSLAEAPTYSAKKPKAAIIFADPQYNRSKLPTELAVSRTAGDGQLKFGRLLHSEFEAKEIEKVFLGKGEARLLLKEEANERQARNLLGYRVIHFSAHGLVNERRPRLSGLVLSLPPVSQSEDSATQDDGILSAYEIFNLKLSAELVTLSACQTALGKEVEGEGLASLARAFMYAGTPSVLASLWKVDDAGTASLMADFYRFWQQGQRRGNKVTKLNKAAALREAQLMAIAEGSQPFYWAPFVLLGKAGEATKAR